MNNYYVHQISSDLNLFGLSLPYYWLIYPLGYFWTYWFCLWLTKRKQLPLYREDLKRDLLWIWFSTVISGRLGYVLIYNWNYFFENPSKILAFWEGGMSFHGALLGGGLSLLFVPSQRRLLVADIICLSLPPLLFLGRLANFINGELPGRVAENTPWAMVFPATDLLPRHPSQIYQALTEGVLLFFFLSWMSRNTQRHGSLVGFFLLGYGSLRFLMEFFREPDPQMGFYFLQLTMGQYLCLLMITMGLLWSLFLGQIRWPFRKF